MEKDITVNMEQWDTPFSKSNEEILECQEENNFHSEIDDKAEDVKSLEIIKNNDIQIPDVEESLNVARNALNTVDDIIIKQYLERLDQMEVISVEDSAVEEKIVIFKVDLMAYEKDEYATDKFVSAFSAMTYTSNSIFLIVDGFEDHTDYYIGVKNSSNYTTYSIADTLESSLRGQFPGIRLTDLSITEHGEKYSAQHRLLRDLKEAKTISSSVGIPALKSEDSYTNNNYIQGIEKFSDAMLGKRYTAIILAQNQMPSSIVGMRKAYEELYSQLSCMASQQLAYSTNESLAHALTRSQGTTDTKSHTVTDGTQTSETKGETIGKNWSEGESKPNFWGKAAPLAGPIMEAGAILSMTGAGAAVGVPIMAIGGVLGIGGMFGAKTTNTQKGSHKAINEGKTTGTNHQESDNNSHSDTITNTEGNTSTIGSSKIFTLTIHNKKVEELLKRIDKQIERLDTAEGMGLWSACAYFLSYDTDKSSSQTGAAIFRSIVQGETSGIETSAINTWVVESDNGSSILQAITSMNHPMFYYSNTIGGGFAVEGSSLISSKELSMIMGFPRKSVPGLPVVDHLSFGKEVVKLNGGVVQKGIDIGVIYDQGVEHLNKVRLNPKSLTQHTFVTGSTGSGKSETVYRLLEECVKGGVTYLIIEPAKGEYKNVFGSANIFGTNPLHMPLLRINPFRFPDGVHVLEHIDRLVEIFNVCWPMYAAMPAVLKKAVIKSYEKCGWILYESVNKYDKPIFPSFVDLLNELEIAINQSAYSEEVKGNYIGSLVTRVESLTNGINGEIFSANEIGDDILYDENTIVDLSRVGAQETKSLIMGILIMRLNEYRVVNAKEANTELRHITVLEEAHNILQRTSIEQSMESSNVAGKSVEMLINSIAEMRTYGEGFVIVDQSPTSVHAAAIKNTNTKIIMRLPDGDDRRISGKSAGMKENQIDEIAKLPTGVAVVYQNDWIGPVMSKINMMTSERVSYRIKPDIKHRSTNKVPHAEILKLLLKGRLMTTVKPNLALIEAGIIESNFPMSFKAKILDAVKEFQETKKLALWQDDNFVELSHLITNLLGLSKKTADFTAKASSFEELNILLSNLIQERYAIPEYMDLSVRQSLMRDYAENGASQLKIYKAWLLDTKESLQ